MTRIQDWSAYQDLASGFGWGDSFWDADTNTFHWVPGVPVAGSPTALAPESSRKYLDAHLASKQRR